MRALRTLLVLAAVAAVAYGQVPAFGWCPDQRAKPDFDFEKFLGVWYEAERYMNVFEAGTRCVRSEYSKAKDGRIIVNNEIQNRLTGVKRVLAGEIRNYVKGTEATLNVKYSTLPYPYESSYKILETDYDTFAVIWGCSGMGVFNTQNAWLMTREQNPSVSILQKAYAIMDSKKISRTFMTKTDQTDCHIAETVSNNQVDNTEEEEEASKSAGPESPEKPAMAEGESEPKPVEKEPESDGVRKEGAAEEPAKKPAHEEPIRKTAEEPKKPAHEEPTKKTAEEPAKSQ